MAKLKNCKTCGEEIAKSAKVCPKCGGKQGSTLWKIVKIVLVLWVVIAVIAAIIRTGNGGSSKVSVEGEETTQKSVETNQKPDSGPKIIPTSKALKVGDVKIRIKNVSKGKQFSDSTGLLTATAQKGAVLVAVLMEYENIGQKPINPFSLPQLYLVSPTGIKYEQDLGKSAAYAGIKEIDQKVLSEINPGLSSEDVFVYEVSEKLFNEKGWKIRVGNVRSIMYGL